MEGSYCVLYREAEAGKVQLIRQGLYYRVICRCQVPGDLVCRLYAEGEGYRENLGVVVPEGDGFVLDRRVPAKKLSGSPVRFVLSSGSGSKPGKLVPVSPEEPFQYIDRLKNAFLHTENGKACIRLEESPEMV